MIFDFVPLSKQKKIMTTARPFPLIRPGSYALANPCGSLRLLLCVVALILSLFTPVGSAVAATINVDVGPGGALTFEPFSVTVQPGDTVKWTWKSAHHSVTSGDAGAPTSLFDSGLQNSGATFSFVFTTPGDYTYHCTPHGADGMIGVVFVEGSTPTPTPTPSPSPTATPTQPLNISTRMQVLTADKVLIGGFIVTGTDPKKVILRAIGPSLAAFGIANPLPDPVIELHASDQSLITSNDNWKETNESEIAASGLAPTDDLESAIITTLEPGSYTAIVSGKDGAIGVGLVEGYDLDQPADSELANISTRGFVETGTNVMIGGFILGGNDGNATIVVRALGPSLSQFGVADALADPTLELRDQNGALIQGNNDWKDTQQMEIAMTGLQPTLDLEAAILSTLGPGAYTAIVAGESGATGVGLVEVYRLP